MLLLRAGSGPNPQGCRVGCCPLVVSDQAVHPGRHQPRRDLGARPHHLLQRSDSSPFRHVPASHGKSPPFHAHIGQDLPRSRSPLPQTHGEASTIKGRFRWHPLREGNGRDQEPGRKARGRRGGCLRSRQGGEEFQQRRRRATPPKHIHPAPPPIGSVKGEVHPPSPSSSRNSELFPAKGPKIVRGERAILLSLRARPLRFHGNGGSVWLGHSRGTDGRDDGLFYAIGCAFR